jgi:hypothetical protein
MRVTGLDHRVSLQAPNGRQEFAYGLLTMCGDDSRTGRNDRPAAGISVQTGRQMCNEGRPDWKLAAPPLAPDARKHIGAQLKVVFAGIEGEPIPDGQIDLLLALRRVERDLGRKEP